VDKVIFTLKTFQRQALARVRSFCETLATAATPQDAFIQVGGEGIYQDPPLLNAPSVCLAIPTGGGKTIIAAAAAGIVAQHALRRAPVVVVWLVPSTAIAEQTITHLRSAHHPVQQALTMGLDGYGGVGPIRVLTITQALRLPPSIYHATTVVIVATMQQFRVADPLGRSVYAPNDIVADEHGDSLVAVLAARRPLLIVDEAHNARTPLSFDSLARLSPGFILELTATPTRKPWPSNVLIRIDATTLKSEHVLKLPLVLTTSPDPERCLAAAVAKRAELAAIAHSAPPYIRPILLIQAQARRHGDALTTDVVHRHLIQLGEDPASIAIATGEQRELDDINLAEESCPITIIITVEALREGWDCPFAAVLCTLRQQFSSTAATQLVGRILRQPYTRPHAQPALNQSFAFALADSFDEALLALRGCLVEGLGFGKHEALAAIVSSAHIQTNQAQTILSAPNPPFMVPRLAVLSATNQEQWELFSDTHRLAFEWELPVTTAQLALGDYLPGDASSLSTELDVDDQGEWFTTPNESTPDPLPCGTASALVNWLERRLWADDIRPDELQQWVVAAVEYLLHQRQLLLETIDQDRWRLAQVLRERLNAMREHAERLATDKLLSRENVRTAAPADYFCFAGYSTDSEPATGFRRHAYPNIAAFDSQEEQRAAQVLDLHPSVHRWVRNPVGAHGFALPRRPLHGRRWFYPDLIAELTSGALLIVEVKGSHLADTIDTADKIDAAHLWATTTGNGFVLVVDGDLEAIELALRNDDSDLREPI
jgi:type III restriction enzyme